MTSTNSDPASVASDASDDYGPSQVPCAECGKRTPFALISGRCRACHFHDDPVTERALRLVHDVLGATPATTGTDNR